MTDFKTIDDDTPVPGSQERQTFEVEGIGEFRARRGTSTAELAGAAEYWSREAKAIKARLLYEVAEAKNKARWEGIFTGALSSSILWGIIWAYIALTH